MDLLSWQARKADAMKREADEVEQRNTLIRNGPWYARTEAYQKQHAGEIDEEATRHAAAASHTPRVYITGVGWRDKATKDKPADRPCQ